MPQSNVKLVRLDEIKVERVRHLWQSRIPIGKITILQGDPGLGKSTMSLDIAARVTHGDGMPDASESELGGPAGVVILTAEDGLADTIRPRLDAAGADVSRVVSFGPEEQLLIPRDVGKICSAIRQVGARLLLIDPLAAFLDATVNSWNNQQVRRALTPLAKTAESTDAAVLVLDHLSKASGRAAIYRGNGSIGMNAAARSVLLVGKDPQEQETFVLASVKCNLSRKPRSLRYRTEEAANGAVRIEWLGECDTNADELGVEEGPATDSKLAGCAEWLRQRLNNGSSVLESIVRKEALGQGYSERTYKRARQQAGVKSTRAGEHWVLSLTYRF